MSAQPVDVLAWMAMARRVLNGGRDTPTSREHVEAFMDADDARAAVAELIEQYRALIELAESAIRSDYEGTSMLDEMLAELAPYRATLARVQGAA